MASSPSFQRAPRLIPETPHGAVEIPAPPHPPIRPSMSLFGILLPGAFSVVFVVAMVLLMGTQDQRYLVMTILSGGFMAVTSVVSLQNYVSQRLTYRRHRSERDRAFQELLAARRRDLAALLDQQRKAEAQTHPDPEECLARVERVDRRLWERRPTDADFLSLRLGLGAQPFGIAVTAVRADAVTPDPLSSVAQELAEEFNRVADLAVCLPLGQAGMAGLIGPRALVVDAARTLAVQIATHHAPSEVKLVVLYPPEESAAWAWMRWLPHVWSDDRRGRFLASDRSSAHELLLRLYETANRRRLGAAPDASAPDGPATVILIADLALLEGEPIRPLLALHDRRLGLYPVFFADRVEALPPGCQAIAEMGPGRPRLTRTEPETVSTPLEPDAITVDRAERLARGMAPLRLLQVASSAQIPTAVSLLDLLDVRRVEQLDVLERWKASQPSRSLAARIGRRAGGEPLLLDLHERGHGPHGLAAGATGSGKSELLQSLVAALAVEFHPHELAFVLVDYKGGGMANAFADLPHLIGTITNLEGTLAARSLAALKSELHRRETLLAEAGVTHIDAYQRLRREGRVDEPLPHLVMIVDEFAELKAEQPDFMRELVSAVRVGRSLGVHLLLATQKPAGVVDEQIWANSRFRLCLRVERPEDSQEVLKRPDAASLTRAGQAFFQVGQNEVFEQFQAAWAGSPYRPVEIEDSSSIDLFEVALDGRRVPLRQGLPAPSAMPAESHESQLQALVEHVREVAESAGIERLTGPWLPPLPTQITLEEIRPAEGWNGRDWSPPHVWLEPVIGVLDDPARQQQEPLRLPLGSEGHIAIYGAPGSGKTTFVQTVVASLALTYSPQDVHVYILDFGGRSLSIFAPLPHVGAVITADEAERLGRLLRYLTQQMNLRKTKFAEVGVNTLAAYRAVAAEPLPAIVVILDNYAAFSGTYDMHEDTLAEISREGGNLGIHLVLTANATMAIRPRISGNIVMSVALHLADRSDYSTVVGRTLGLEPAANEGRGLIKGNPPLEFQTALPIAGAGEAERALALRERIRQLDQAWDGPRPRAIRVLPAEVPLCDLLPDRDDWTMPVGGARAAVVGLDVDEIEPLTVDLNDGPHFLITGPPQGGKTVFLQSWLLALAEALPPEYLQLCLVDFRQEGLRPLARLPQTRAFATNDDEFVVALNQIDRAMQNRQAGLGAERAAAGGVLDQAAWLAERAAIVIAIDPFGAFNESGYQSKELLGQILRRDRDLGLHVIMAGSTGDFSSSWDEATKATKELQTGFLLGSSDYTDIDFFGIRLPLGESGKPLPPGQGFVARRSRHVKFKAATAHVGAETLQGIVDRLVNRRPPAVAEAAIQPARDTV